MKKRLMGSTLIIVLVSLLISNAADSRAYRKNQTAIRKAMQEEGAR